MSPVKRTRHAVYDLKYHIVWIPKYRKIILEGEIAIRLKEIFQKIAERYDFEIDTMEIMEDHVHLFILNIILGLFLPPAVYGCPNVHPAVERQ